MIESRKITLEVAALTHLGKVRPSNEDAVAVAKEVGRPGLMLALFACSGAVSLSTQIAWSRVAGILLGSSVYSFALVLATFLVGIAAGAALIVPWVTRRGPSWRLFAGLQWFAALGILYASIRIADAPWDLLGRIVLAHGNVRGLWVQESLLPPLPLTTSGWVIEALSQADLRQLEVERANFEIARLTVVSASRQLEALRQKILQERDASGTSSTLDILGALQSLLGARNALANGYITYEQLRVKLLLDLEALQLDSRGYPLDERQPDPDVWFADDRSSAADFGTNPIGGSSARLRPPPK